MNRYAPFVVTPGAHMVCFAGAVKASRVGHAAEAGSLVATPGSPLFL